MIVMPTERFDFQTEVSVVVGFSAETEIEYTGIVAAFKDESGRLHLEKSNGNFIEISSSYLYFEVQIGRNE